MFTHLIKDFKLDTVNAVLPKSVGEWLTDYLTQLDALSNSIQGFFKNEAVERVKYVSHNINCPQTVSTPSSAKRREVKKK